MKSVDPLFHCPIVFCHWVIWLVNMTDILNLSPWKVISIEETDQAFLITADASEANITALLLVLPLLEKAHQMNEEIHEKISTLPNYTEISINVDFNYETLHGGDFQFFQDHRGHNLRPITEYDAVDNAKMA